MTTVPAQYQAWVQTASQQTGLSESIVAAQISTESGFDPSVTSGAGAEGIAQIMPSTWANLGISGTPYDAADALQGYVKLMSELLHQYGGNVRNALAAYNAGSNDISAGYGYADSILSAAGAGTSATATPSTASSTASAASGTTATSSGSSSGLSGALSALSGSIDGIPLYGIAVIGGGIVLGSMGLWASGVLA